MRKPPLTYSGPLKEPIVARPDRRHYNERLYGAWDAKLELLLDHYGIEFKEPECWLTLALCLASDHVPGFEIVSAPKKGPGAHKKWTVSKARQLVDAVDAIKAEKPGNKVTYAVTTLAKRHPEKWPAKTKEARESLRVRYYESKKHLCRVKEAFERVYENKNRLFVQLSSPDRVYK